MRKIVLVFGLLVWGCAHADLDITVTGGQTAAQPIAVVPFKNEPGVTFDVAQIVQDDLARSGLFNPLKRSDMLEQPSDPSQVNYRNWRVLGMNDIVIGQERKVGDNVAVRFYLMDVFRSQQLLGFDLPATPPDQLRYVAHRIADLVYEKLTGSPGYFDTQIAYVSGHGLGDARTFKLIVCDSDGKYPRGIASSKEPLMSPAWSPDRKKLAFVGYQHGRSSIYIDTLATGHLQKFTGEPGINGAPAWSPDGRFLAVTLSYGRNPDIYIYGVETGRKLRLTHSPAIDTEASWSPDGKNIVFTSDRGGSPQIYEMPVNGSSPPRRLTFQGKQNLRARYSPDGKTLALVNYDGGAYRIALFDLQSGNMHTITDGPLDESPSYAPNGGVIIYAKRNSSGTELATVSVDGRINQTIKAAGDIQEPAWSPYIQQ